MSTTDVRSPVARLCVSPGGRRFWRYPRGVAWCRGSAASTSALAQLPVQASAATDEVFMSGSCPESRATRFCTRVVASQAAPPCRRRPGVCRTTVSSAAGGAPSRRSSKLQAGEVVELRGDERHVWRVRSAGEQTTSSRRPTWLRSRCPTAEASRRPRLASGRFRSGTPSAEPGRLACRRITSCRLSVGTLISLPPAPEGGLPVCPLWFPGIGGSWQGSALARQPDPDRQRQRPRTQSPGELEAQQPGPAGCVVLQPGRVVSTASSTAP